MTQAIIDNINRNFVKRAPDSKLLRPRDAATVILLDTRSHTPKMLMGRRNPASKFMPGVFVFPGGRVDPADGMVPHLGSLAVHDHEKLAKFMPRPTDRRIHALAMAALRETFEETGLHLGVKNAAMNARTGKWRSGSWQEFFADGLVPSLDGLMFIARAITPPGRNRRFDTRFFARDVSDIADTLVDRTTPDSELVELRWVTCDEAMQLDVVEITALILSDLKRQIDENFAPERMRPLFRAWHGKFQRVHL